MDSNIKLSTQFLTTQNAHQVAMLVTLSGQAPASRLPINVALVLDRSGSMGGEPLEAAKEAAARFAQFLGPNDTVSVVAFDDEVQTVFGPARAGDHQVGDAIRRIDVGATTNLSGGWLKGREHVSSGMVEGTNRIVLLTDGMANQGITDPDQLCSMARGAFDDRVTTTCIGFGGEFNEDLLESMANAGGANYWYIESIDQMGPVFDEEIEGLVSLVAQNAAVRIRLTHAGVQGVTLVQDLPVERPADGSFAVTIGDVYATSPRELGLIFHVDNLEAMGPTTLGEVEIKADVVTDVGIEHRTTIMPVVANLDGADHPDPQVDTTITRFKTAQARRKAVKSADRGDFDEAAKSLRGAHVLLSRLPMTDQVMEEMDDLDVEASRMEQGDYLAEVDAKYHKARSRAVHMGKVDYIQKISRRWPRKDDK